MSRSRSALPLMVCLVAGLVPVASADRVVPRTLGLLTTQSQPGARILIHVVPADISADSSTVCAGATFLPCTAGVPSYNTTAPLSSPEVPYYFAYVIVTGYDPAAGFSGVQFGIDYDGAALSGVDILDWTSCSVLEFPSDGWPGPGTGTMCTWFPDHPSAPVACRRDAMTVVGYFTISVFSPDVLDLTARPVDGELKVADCSKGETLLDELAAGAAGFGGPAGQDPCVNPPPPPPDPPTSPPRQPVRFLLHAVAAGPEPERECLESTARCIDGYAPPVTEVPLSTGENPEFIVYFIPDGGGPFSTPIVGTQFEIRFPSGIEVLEWRPCSFWEIVGSGPLVSPASGTKIAIGFQRECDVPTAVLGYFRIRVTAPGLFELTNARVARCETRGYTWSPEPVWTGAVGFGQPGRGCDATLESPGFVFPSPACPVTWSDIKSRYAD